jgi:hypothetical protein
MAGNVLYLDWESCKEDHQRRVWAIKQGLVREGIAVSPDETFAYQFEKGPLVDDIYYIQRLVTENNIEFMVIDSHMAAQGYGPDQAQVASQFYNTLRSLNCTTLTIDHVDKASWRGLGETVGPYGSVVKFNRSRAQFELIKQQGTGEDFVELALKHTKNNEGRLLPPIGIRIDFTNNENDELECVSVSQCDIKNNAELSKITQSLKQRLIDLLENQPMAVRELHEALGSPESHIRTELNRKAKKQIFVKNEDDTWGLITNNTLF